MQWTAVRAGPWPSDSNWGRVSASWKGIAGFYDPLSEMIVIRRPPSHDPQWWKVNRLIKVTYSKCPIHHKMFNFWSFWKIICASGIVFHLCKDLPWLHRRWNLTLRMWVTSQHILHRFCQYLSVNCLWAWSWATSYIWFSLCFLFCRKRLSIAMQLTLCIRCKASGFLRWFPIPMHCFWFNKIARPHQIWYL